MKIKVTDKSYEEVMALPREEHRKPLKPSIFFRTLLKLLSAADLKATNFQCRSIGNSKVLYYCFPAGQQDVVAKTRLAAEELYKLTKAGMLPG